MDNATIPGAELGIGLASVKMAMALLLVLGLLFLGLALLKRLGFAARWAPGSKGNLLTIVERLVLGPRKQVIMVRFLNKYLVLGVTDAQINLIAEQPIDHEQPTDFHQVLEDAHHQEPLDSGASADSPAPPGS